MSGSAAVHGGGRDRPLARDGRDRAGRGGGGGGAPDKRRLGWVAYAVSGLAHLRMPAADFAVRLDGGEPLRRRARCVVVGNAGLLPGGFALLPEARLDDGRLDVGILAPAGVLGWPRAAARVLTRSAAHGPDTGTLPGPAGGDRGRGRLPAGRRRDRRAGRTLTVSVCPGALTVRQPEGGGT